MQGVSEVELVESDLMMLSSPDASVIVDAAESVEVNVGMTFAVVLR